MSHRLAKILSGWLSPWSRSAAAWWNERRVSSAERNTDQRLTVQAEISRPGV